MRKAVLILIIFVSTAYSQSVIIFPKSSVLILHWHPNTEPDLAGYNVYLDSAGTWINKFYTPDTIVMAATNDTTLKFAVTAKDLSGNESDKSVAVKTSIHLLRLDYSLDSLNRIDINDVWEYHKEWKKHLGKKVRETIP